MNLIFHRTAFAESLAQRLLHPDVLDESLRSGVFFAGMRRTGKSTFLQFDLVPALEARGAIVVYVDLWSAPARAPASLVHEAIRATLAELENPASRLIARLKDVAGVNIGAPGFDFGFEVERVGDDAGPTLAKVLTELVDRAGTDVVLIVDEVQHALGSTDGENLLLSLKAARDAVNLRPDTAGHFLFVGTGSHRSLVGELTAQRSQAFAGAYATDYPLLGEDYVSFLLERLERSAADRGGEPMPLPSLPAATRAFEMIGRRPEELIRALGVLRSREAAEGDPDEHLLTVAATLRASAADVELAKVDRLGALAAALFERIVNEESDAKPARGLFGADSVARLAERLGREVSADEITPALNALIAENLVIRRGHGRYGVTDPFVREMALERRAFAETFPEAAEPRR